MDEIHKDHKRSGKNYSKNSPLDQYTRHFNYSVFPNFKVYSLSAHPASNPVDSAAATAAADTTLTFSDPLPIVTALPSETVAQDVNDTQKQLYQKHKEQHLRLQQQLEQHKQFHTEKRHSEQRKKSPDIVLPRKEITQDPICEGPICKGSLKESKITKTLFPPRAAQQESSKSILFRAFTNRWMTDNDESALVLATDPIGDPDELRNRIRTIALKVREPVAEYQVNNGVPLEQQISFVDLIRMLFVCSQTAVFTILTMLWNLYPLLDGFLYVIRFVLDKVLYICQGETPAERSYRSCIFAGEMIILFLANLFIIHLIVMPIVYLVLCSMGNCMRLLGLYA